MSPREGRLKVRIRALLLLVDNLTVHIGLDSADGLDYKSDATVPAPAGSQRTKSMLCAAEPRRLLSYFFTRQTTARPPAATVEEWSARKRKK